MKINTKCPDHLHLILINPFYAINIDDSLTYKHEPIVNKNLYIRTQKQIVKEIGFSKWLDKLLSILEGKHPVILK